MASTKIGTTVQDKLWMILTITGKDAALSERGFVIDNIQLLVSWSLLQIHSLPTTTL